MRAARGLYHHEKRASELVKGHLGLLGVSRGLALPVKGEPNIVMITTSPPVLPSGGHCSWFLTMAPKEAVNFLLA